MASEELFSTEELLRILEGTEDYEFSDSESVNENDLESLQKPVSGKLDVQLKKLKDYFMTDTISRASPTMAKCVQAVLKQKQSPY